MSDDLDFWLSPPAPKKAPAPPPPAPRLPPRSVLPGLPTDDYLVRMATAYLSAGASVTEEPNGRVVLRMPGTVALPPGWSEALHTTIETYALALAIHDRRETAANEMRAALAKRLAIVAGANGDLEDAARRLVAAGEGDAVCRIILGDKR